LPLFNWQTLRELEKHTEAAIAAGFRICSGKITFSGQTVAGSMMLVSGRYFQVMAVQPSAGPPELRQRRRTGPPATRSQW